MDIDINPPQDGEDHTQWLTESVRKEFEEHYAKFAPIQFEATDGSCSRCGSMVTFPAQDRHVTWHKNISLQMWLMAGVFRNVMMPHISRVQEAFKALGELIMEEAADAGEEGS